MPHSLEERAHTTWGGSYVLLGRKRREEEESTVLFQHTGARGSPGSH